MGKTQQQPTTTTTTKVVAPATAYTVPDKYEGFSETVFAPQKEFSTPMPCEVVGEIPPWIHGAFIRVGAGQFKWGTTEVAHLFDGDAMAHRFQISEGEVKYSRKFLDTEYHRKNKKYNCISSSGFATWAPPDPCASMFRRLAMYFIPTMDSDNANVNVYEIQGKTYVSTEVPWMFEIDKTTLDTIKKVAARSNLGSQSMSMWLAHPHFEEDGSVWIFNTVQGPYPQFQLINIPPTPSQNPIDNATVVASIDASTSQGGYYHSFAMTENYFVLMPNPLIVGSIPALLTKNFTRKSMFDIMEFRGDMGNELHVVERRTGRVLRTCRVQGCMVFHHANAYEKDGEIVMDLTRFPDNTCMQQFYMQNLRHNFKGNEMNPGQLVRYRIPLSECYKDDPQPYHLPTVQGENADYEVLAAGVYSPVINYDRVNGKEYSYVFGMEGFFLEPRLSKTNVNTKETIYWTPPPNTVPTLPFFWGNPEGESEDDGVLLTTCTGANGERSFFVVLDGQTMKEICRANMPVHINWAFHGNFFPTTAGPAG